MHRSILILGRKFHPDGKETADDIFSGLNGTGKFEEGQLCLAHYSDLLFDISNEKISITDTKNQIDLADFGAVLMTNWFSHASIRKDVAYSAGLYLSEKGVRFFNAESANSRSSSKLSQMVLAAQNSVSIPRTVFSLSFDTLASHAASSLGFPCIFKDAQASRGQSNHLIRSVEELEPLRKEHTEKHPFMAQSFIDSGKVDYRFFVAGGKTKLVIKRSSQGDSHLTNTSAGGNSELLSPDALGQDGLRIAQQTSAILKREVTGVDIMVDKNTQKLYFLEANPIPQIATGSNPDKKLDALAEALIEASKGE